MAELSQADRNRFRAAVDERAERRAAAPRRWTEELGRLVREVIALKRRPDVDKNTAFWLRLWGALVEGGAYYEEIRALHVNLGTTTTSIARDSLAVLDAIKAARAAFNEDERIWIHYRRDTECHLVPESYEVSVNKKARKLKATRRLELLDKDITVDEIWKRCGALLRKHGLNEHAMAAPFASIVAPHIPKILEAMRPLFEPNRARSLTPIGVAPPEFDATAVATLTVCVQSANLRSYGNAKCRKTGIVVQSARAGRRVVGRRNRSCHSPHSRSW